MRWLRSLFTLAPVLSACVPVRAQDVSSAEVRQAVTAAVGYLKWISTDGAWSGAPQFTGGATTISALALLSAGVPVDDPVLKRALERVVRLEDRWTYVASLRIAVLAATDPARYSDEISRSARFLIRGQLRNGQWTYTAGDFGSTLRGDNSNTQFALLGLHEAARVGTHVPRELWTRAEQHWVSSQNRDGGWGYVRGQSTSTGSMTAAGVASLLIVGHEVNRTLERGYTDRGVAPGCGKYAQNKSLAAGLRWLAQNFSATGNPRSPQWALYWLYGAERVGILSGLKYFGSHDWYRAGAAHLVETQSRDGSWNGNTIDTAFAVLFLAKGQRPLLFNKLAWSRDDRWQPDRHDVEHLVGFIGADLGEAVAWQAVALNAPLSEWLEAPILYITGHTFPRLSSRERAKLRQYVDGGGTLLIEACCSREAVQRGFEEFAADVFKGYDARPLGPEHPVWTARYTVDPAAFPLLGIDTACRTSVIFSPRDLSCLWEQMDVRNLSGVALRLGANIAVYATGREALRRRLDVVELPSLGRRDAPAEPVGAALQLAQLVHDGDWNPDRNSLIHLAELLRVRAGLDVSARSVALRASDSALFEHPIVYMTGHFSFELRSDEIGALRTYLERGGLLLADACCGRSAFDQSFRRLCGTLFADQPLKPLPSDHPIFAGKPGYAIDRVEYRPALAAERGNAGAPELLGITRAGRTLIVYSPFGIGCGLEGHRCYACRGLAEESAKKLATNIVLYALSY